MGRELERGLEFLKKTLKTNYHSSSSFVVPLVLMFKEHL
jgi:hypothetical protein